MKKFLTFTALLLIPVLVMAQAKTTGTVRGTVMDEDGNPVENARITLVSDKMQGDRIVNSSDKGAFLAALLPSGIYSAEITAPGFSTQALTFRVAIGEIVPLEVTLKRGELVEEVTVYSTPAALETTAIGEIMNSSEVDSLPVQVRTLDAIALFAPNVAFGPASGGDSNQANDSLSIAGAPSYDTVYLLDGAEISDPLFGGGTEVYLEDAIEETQVLTSGISARYGRFQGGVINAITKSGGNKFSGTARWEFDRESWNSMSPFGETQSETFNNTYWATLGGFIVKDHLWFWGGYREIPVTDDTRTSTVYPSITTPGTFFNVTRTTAEDRWQGKLRGALNSNHILDVSRLEFDSAQTPRAGLPFVDTRAGTGTRSDPRETTTLTYQGVLTPNLFADVQWTEKKASIISGANDASLGSPVLDWTGTGCGGFCVFKNHWWGGTSDPDQRDNETAAINFTQTINTNWGTHTLEYGGGYVETITGGKNSQSVTGLNLVYDTTPVVPISWDGDNDTATFALDSSWIIERWNAPAVGIPAGGFSANLEDTAFYVQDSLEIGKFRIDAGLRYETYDGKGPFIEETVNFDDIAPRLGVTYNLDQNWQLQANWGKYVARINDNQSNSVTFVGENPSQTEVYTGPAFAGLSYDEVECVLRGFDPGDTGGACDPQNPVVTFGPNNAAYWGTVIGREDPQAPTTFLLPDFEAPHANDFNVSVRRRLPNNSGTFTITYSQRDFEALTDDFVGGVTSLFSNLDPRIVDVPGTGNGLVAIDTDADGTNDNFVDAIVWGNSDQATRQYQGLTGTFEYRPSPVWNVGGNYTFSETTGNYEGEGGNTPGSGSAIGDFIDSRPDSAAVPFGFLDEDIRHRAQVWGTYTFDFDKAGSLTLGSLTRYQSGRAYSLLATVARGDSPDYIAEAGGYEHFFDGRGNNRFNGWWDTSLSARYQFPIWRSLNGWVKADIRNLFDQDELIEFNTAGSSVTNAAGTLEFSPGGGFGSPANRRDFQTPREYLFTVGLSF